MLLSKGLAERGFETKLVTGRLAEAEGDMAYLARERGVEVVTVPELCREIRPSHDLMALSKLIGLCRRFRPHIVHTHTSKAGMLGRLAALAAGVPVRVHTFHGHVFGGYFSPAKTRLFVQLEKTLALFTDRLVALSALQKKELSTEHRVAPARKLEVIPLGFEHLGELKTCRAVHSGELREQLGVAPHCPLVGAVGRLVDIKRPDVFIDAASLIAKERPDAHFVLAGDGYLLEPSREKAASLGISDRVHFLGWARDLAKLYADLDVFVLTSRNEGTPVAAIEALAAGVPVVATNVGGVPDVLEGGRLGRIVPAGDPASAAKAVLDTLNDMLGDAPEERGRTRGVERMAPHGAPSVSEEQRRVARRYSAERLLGDVETLYRALVASKGCS